METGPYMTERLQLDEVFDAVFALHLKDAMTRLARDEMTPHLADCFPLVERSDVTDSHPQQLFPAVSEKSRHRGIDVDVMAVIVDEDDSVDRIVE